jgi:hypothetical protein
MSAFGDLSRRSFLRVGAASAAVTLSPWFGRLATAAADHPARKRACILLWMNGGPSQMETFDPKPGHKNGGPVKAIDTAVPGIQISEFLPQIADRMKHLAVVRSMATKEADHQRGTYLMRTGRVPGGPIQYPSLGAFVGKELDSPNAELPCFVSVAPIRQLSQDAYGPGFLGPRYAPLVVGEGVAQVAAGPNGPDVATQLRVQDLDRPANVSARRDAARVALLDEMESDFAAERPGAPADSHRTAYRRAVTLMRSAAVKAFDLTGEPAKLRDAYGRNLFGQGCLLARRLVEAGVPFIEVSLTNVPGQNGAFGWDTHSNNFDNVKRLCGVLDPAWATLIDDLKDHGLLETTTIVWMGEFGRTPNINGQNGRDHWANSWSAVIGGGGITGGQVVGKTSDDGMTVKDRPVAVADLLATVCEAVGLDPGKQNMSNVGRPIRLVEANAKPIREVLA